MPPLKLLFHCQPQEMLMISKSGVYALLIFNYARGNRLQRSWLTYEVVSKLRGKCLTQTEERPPLSMLD
jgi:prophage antirepressor-like protein